MENEICISHDCCAHWYDSMYFIYFPYIFRLKLNSLWMTLFRFHTFHDNFILLLPFYMWAKMKIHWKHFFVIHTNTRARRKSIQSVGIVNYAPAVNALNLKFDPVSLQNWYIIKKRIRDMQQLLYICIVYMCMAPLEICYDHFNYTKSFSRSKPAHYQYNRNYLLYVCPNLHFHEARCWLLLTISKIKQNNTDDIK